MSNTILYVICGHGGGDPGACANGFQEAERVRALAGRIKALGGARVVVGDMSKNWYRQNLISSLNVSKNHELLELHLNASVKTSAKGGHVIINKGVVAKDYDRILADFITDMFPGWWQRISERDDLANPKRAADKGYGYRLLECCFISNTDDITKFNAQLDDVAKGILNAFGIEVTTKEEKEEPKVDTPTTDVPFMIRVANVASNDVLNIRKNPHYLAHKTGELKYNDPNLYTIVEVKNGWGRLKSGIGWINLKYTTRINEYVAPATPTPKPVTINVGDVVQFTGDKHYTSAYAGGIAKPCKPGQVTVTKYYKGKPHPYLVQAVKGKGSTAYGYVNAEDLTVN